jgi:hypothetical protein
LTLLVAAGVYVFVDQRRVSPGVTTTAFSESTRETQPMQPQAPKIFTPNNSRPAEKVAPGVLLLPDANALVGRLHAPDATVQEDLDILQSVVELYRRANNGANPTGGLNEEIMDALQGRDRKRVAAFPPNHVALDAGGRLLDRWGTPYFFHPVSGKVLEIRSAGPDAKLWTSDDVMLGEAED